MFLFFQTAFSFGRHYDCVISIYGFSVRFRCSLMSIKWSFLGEKKRSFPFFFPPSYSLFFSVNFNLIDFPKWQERKLPVWEFDQTITLFEMEQLIKNYAS